MTGLSPWHGEHCQLHFLHLLCCVLRNERQFDVRQNPSQHWRIERRSGSESGIRIIVEVSVMVSILSEY